ncbi:DUF445 domain-containing protein [Sphingomonas sp. GC_Shp_3]|uniref:DUF445 domain-containing protein n=1 Tax=Sphingomonas sp. GC_Shp_3 TaxID=2937383 RepID=UPI00226ABBCD|nr:DUF445 domain-containing protein [Sphingomonas sp. GC_Shp_3]
MTKARRLSTEAAPPGLVRMRLIATGLLLAMAAVFLVSRTYDQRWPALGFVRAFAEAAMVGGLADWFAVTALFRHPLGVPIPHTAIIPRNKDRIGDTLATFLRDNFLIPRVVARRMLRLDVAGAAGLWLANPLARDGRIARGASAMTISMLQALDQQRLGGIVRGMLGKRLADLDVAPLLGQALTAAIAEERHLPLLDGIVRWAARILEANDHLIRAMVHDRAGSIMRWTGLDETLSNKIIAGLNGLLTDMADNPEHPLRAKADEGLASLAHDLMHSPEMQARVEAIKAEIIANPAMQRWLDGVWEQARIGMMNMARDPDRVMRGPIGDALRQLGDTLGRESMLRATINRFVRRAVVGIAADYGDNIVRLVSETVKGWDADTITSRLENAVGRDLQYIRINGTLVGGLVGLVIHTVDVALG